MLKLNPCHKPRRKVARFSALAAALALAVSSLFSANASAHDVHRHSDWRPVHAQHGPYCRHDRGGYRGGWQRSDYRPHYRSHRRYAPVRRPVYVESTPYYHSDSYYRRGPGPGALIGAAIGGLVGAQVGSGEGRLAATAAGVVGGFLLGQDIDGR